MSSKTLFLIACAGGLLLAVGAAANGGDKVSATLSTPGTERVLHLPAAAGNSPVISLGSAVDPQTGETVEGYAIVHYGASPAKPSGNAAKPPKTTQVCYAVMASGAVWKTVEPWVLNPANTQNLTADYLLSNLSGDMLKWEDATDGIIGNSVARDVLGNGTLTSAALSADQTAPDGVNEVYFGSIDSPGAIAVTIVWGVFGGPTQNRKLMEWDMVFDEADYAWSASGDATKMDFENIATHELGHSVGLDHPLNTCVEETMYAYASFGETKKRDLNAGDVAGMNGMY